MAFQIVSGPWLGRTPKIRVASAFCRYIPMKSSLILLQPAWVARKRKSRAPLELRIMSFASSTTFVGRAGGTGFGCGGCAMGAEEPPNSFFQKLICLVYWLTSHYSKCRLPDSRPPTIAFIRQSPHTRISFLPFGESSVSGDKFASSFPQLSHSSFMGFVCCGFGCGGCAAGAGEPPNSFFQKLM